MTNSRDEFSPLFLIVSERCGGNLLMNMVSAHPELHSPLPPHVFRLISTNALRFGDLDQDENWSNLVDITLRFIRQINEPWRGELSQETIDGRVAGRSVGELLKAVYLIEQEANGVRHILLKENEVFRFMPFLLLQFPKSRFVWQVRDPRDMLSSFKRSSLFSKLMSNSIEIWGLEQQNALNAYPFLAIEQRIHFQRYEDLLADPERVLEELCKFIGVSMSAEMLRYHETELSKNRATTSALRENVSRPLMRGNLEKFREELTEEEIRGVETQVGELMVQLGYSLAFAPAQSTDERLRKRQQMILSDDSTSEADREMRAARVETIRMMLERPLEVGR